MNISPLLEMHANQGARLTLAPGQEPRREVLLTYGDVPAEYRAATQAAMVLDQSDRGLVRIRGTEALDFLHRVTANRVKGLEVGAGNRGLLLTGKGKIVEEYELLVVEGGFDLVTPPGRAASLIAALDLYLFAEDITLEDATQDFAPLVLIGPEAASICAAAFGSDPAQLKALTVYHALTETTASAPRIVATSLAGQAGWRIDCTPDSAAATWQALTSAGAHPGGLAIVDILRAEACVGAFGIDIDDTVYPQEARLDEAFNLEKGCYIGQEVVAKIDTYGGLNKRLFSLSVGDAPIPAGTRLYRHDPERGWRDLGVVTTWSWSFALDTGLVLAYIKRRHQEPGTVFHLAPAKADDDAIASAPTASLVETPLAPALDPA